MVFKMIGLSLSQRSSAPNHNQDTAADFGSEMKDGSSKDDRRGGCSDAVSNHPSSQRAVA